MNVSLYTLLNIIYIVRRQCSAGVSIEIDSDARRQNAGLSLTPHTTHETPEQQSVHHHRVSPSIGLATAIKFAEEGAIVVVCDIKQAAVDAAVAQCQALRTGGGIRARCDATRHVDAVVAQVMNQFGRIDVLVNNAGITQDARLQKMTLEQFDRVIDVNLRVFFTAPRLWLTTWWRKAAVPSSTQVQWCAFTEILVRPITSTFGVIGFTKTWSRELGPKGT